jgi:long-chain acyl-CoA synthetase
LLLRNARDFSDRPAYRHKDLGIWQTWTWSQVEDEVRDLALGLASLGLTRGDRIAIIGSNRPRLYWTFVAAQSIGAVPVPVYQDAVAEEMAYVLSHAEVAMAVVEDQEQVDKLISIADRIPNVHQVIYDLPRGLKKYDHTHLHSFEKIQDLGKAFEGGRENAERWWRGEIENGTGDDISVTLYTSGTTGTSKGVLLTARGCIDAARDTVAFDKLTEKDETHRLPADGLGRRPLSESRAGLWSPAICVACPESPERPFRKTCARSARRSSSRRRACSRTCSPA